MAGNLYRPNSIDIVGADGLVRYGRVVDVTDNGFFVDFLCPSRRRRFFPFDSSVFPSDIRRVFRQDIVADAWAASQAPSPARVEVLMRESPSGPWTWFPAEIVHPPRIADGPHRHYHVVVVRWGNRIDGVMQSDVVPVERIRLPMPVARWASAKGRRSEVMPNELQIAAQRVGKWTFVKRSVKLPDNVAWMSVTELRGLWHSNDDVVNYRPITFVEVRNECLSYLERSFAHQWYEQMDGTLHPEFPETIQKFHNQLIERLPRIIGTPLINTVEVREPFPAAFPFLPPELLLEVFSHLNTMTQTKLRAVCPTWDHILQSPLLTATLLITSCESVDHPQKLEYHMTAPVFRCLTATTRRLIVADWWKQINVQELFKLADMTRYITENNPGIGLTTVYLVGFRLSIPVNVLYAVHVEDDCGLHPPAEGAASNALPEAYRHYNDGHFRDFVALFRQLWCDSVRLICGTIDVFINAMPDRLMRKLLLRIPAAQLMVYDKDLECAMWDMLELGLPRVDDAQLVTLSEFLVWVAAGKNASSPVGLAWDKTVCKVLCAAQSPDPRPQSHYRGRKWCVEGMEDLQLDKLSRITLRFLILLANSAGE